MQVLKFGGTSVASSSSMAQCVSIISDAVERDRTIVVGSAVSGCTDILINIAKTASRRDPSYREMIDSLQVRHQNLVREFIPEEKIPDSLELLSTQFESLRGIAQGVFLLGELSSTSLDAIQGFGELFSTRILAAKLASTGIPTRWVDSRSIIKTHFQRGRNVVDLPVTYANIAKMVEENPTKELFVVPGFIASDFQGRTTTLGRGGSDYTASLFAVGSKSRALETWKDVPGLMTANPKIVPEAQSVHHISYRAAQELSHFGAKVIYSPTIQPVVAERIPIYVKCTFDPSAEGTVIELDPPRAKNDLVGISNSDKIALLSLEGSEMAGVSGVSSKLFQALADNDISIILITQASSVNTMCIAVAEKDAPRAKEATDQAFAYEISLGKINPLKVEDGYSIVCLVGDDIMNQRGTTGRMLDVLGRRNIGVRAVAQGSSERNISVIVKSSDMDSAIRCIHSEFFEANPYTEVNLFIAGYGNVGKALMDILARNRDSIAERLGKRLHLCGLSNSRRFVMDSEGLPLDKAGELLKEGLSAKDDAFFDTLLHTSMQNSIFVDCTASSDISYKYKSLMDHGYSIVACNKIPFAGELDQYLALRESAKKNKVSLRHETTVGAALPILETLERCVNCGDDILSVKAVLSGSVSYILNAYDGRKPLSDVIRDAAAAGYTEPDPRIDLCGRDVLRKLIILARVAQVPLEEKDVVRSNIFPDEIFTKSGEEFYAAVDACEGPIRERILSARANGLRTRFVASLEKDPVSGKYSASVGFEDVDSESPLHNLPGSVNTAIIKTSLYPSPLIIQGGGAGAFQTASGILNDILLS